MMELTKERLMALSNRENVGAICSDEIVAMARQLLAGLKQEPVAYINKVIYADNYGDDVELRAYSCELDAMKSKSDFGGAVIPLYAAPQLPQPAVPDDSLKSKIKGIWWGSGESHLMSDETATAIVEACRAAMLQGAETVQGWIPCGERMPEVSEEVLCAKEFDGPDDWRKKVGYWLAGKWTVYGASWTPTHWMPLPAAPQQEVK